GARHAGRPGTRRAGPRPPRTPPARGCTGPGTQPGAGMSGCGPCYSCSASGRSSPSAARSDVSSPTAVHVRAAVQDTPKRSLCEIGCAVGWGAHAVPFQTSASACGVTEARRNDPIAVQRDFVAQETPARRPLVPVAGSGRACGVHVPLRSCSASGRPTPLAVMYEPTAVHVAFPAQETPVSSPNVPPAGSGTGNSFQETPFHDSANRPSLVLPTAKQSAEDGQENPAKGCTPSGGLGVCWIVQVVPFQCSASVMTPTAPFPSASPTAVQLFGESQETASSSERNVPAGLGVD